MNTGHPLVSVICCIYNSMPLVQKCMDGLFNADEPYEVILVDNHSPDPKSRDFCKSLRDGETYGIKVVTPDRNLGVPGGWNAGYKHATGKYVCKLDDDTVILDDMPFTKMVDALQRVPQLGFISADIDAKQANKYRREIINGVDLEIAETGVVGFSFVMFRRADIERWGGSMKTGPYMAAGGKPIVTERLYGGEEVFLAQAAHADGKIIAHLPGVKCHHMGNDERHPDYAWWKVFYGYYGHTSKPMEEWIESGEALRDYGRGICMELSKQTPNEAWLAAWVLRLSAYGTRALVPTLMQIVCAVKGKTQNGVVIQNCDKAIAELTAK